eukprot:9147571-Alexandrium_andersonii.AAC.1
MASPRGPCRALLPRAPLPRTCPGHSQAAEVLPTRGLPTWERSTWIHGQRQLGGGSDPWTM